MASFNELMAGVSAYFGAKQASRKNSQEFTAAGTGKKTKAQLQVEKKRETNKMRAMSGALQRSDLGVTISDIETNFYNTAIASLQDKTAALKTESEQANKAFAAIVEKHKDDPLKGWTGMGFAGIAGRMANKSKMRREDREALRSGDPNKIIALFEHENENQSLGYHGAARWLNDHWENEQSPIYQAFVEARKIASANEKGVVYGGQLTNAQASLEGARVSAQNQAEVQRGVLDTVRDQAVATLQREIKERGGATQSIETLTETGEGPAKRPQLLGKTITKTVEQPSFYDTRPQ